uniref:hypothetical protein n=1 Tax=Burkholderia arboris TaxID=488730 RepID=UPI003BEEF62C
MSPLIVLTTYFNPCRYRTRRVNYDLFIDDLARRRVPCLTVECAFGDDEFELPERLDVVRVRASSLMWQKERLLNLAASWLPSTCRYVAWIDCDVLFQSDRWADDTVKVLERFPIAQLFETCVRQSAAGTVDEPPDTAESFAAVMRRSPASLEAGRYDVHGHTGYAWAMRRDMFDDVGLYEHAISGSADHFMAHAIYGHYGFCIENALKHDRGQIDHLKVWGRRFHDRVRGRLGVVPGAIRHLWHGDAADRRYFQRMHEITDLGFDPWLDLHARPGAPLEWRRPLDKPGLTGYFGQYFQSRREDGIGHAGDAVLLSDTAGDVHER